MTFLTGGITSGFLLLGCGQAGDAGSAQGPASAETEENIPEGAVSKFAVRNLFYFIVNGRNDLNS